jgi:prepilin-type N-terminal cleavage/methylation domain-containing protein
MRSPHASRPAFSLVELLIALVLLSGGALVVAGTATLVARAIGEGARRTTAARLARATLDSLAALPCASVVAGQDSAPGVAVAWTVDTLPRARAVRQTIRVAVRGGTSTSIVESQLPC